MLRVGLLNPVGLGLLAVSCLIAVAVATLPPLSLWAPNAVLFAAVGLLAYLLTALVYVLPAPRQTAVSHPGMRRLLDLRRQMSDRLAELREARDQRQSPLIPVVADAIRHMDTQLVPTFRSIVVRHEDLSRHLEQYESGRLTIPDPGIHRRLRRIYDRQQEALDVCVRQAANAYATLIALLQEADEDEVIQQARLWASDLNDMYDGLAEVLSGVDPYEQAMLQLRLDGRQEVRPLIEEALGRIEPTVTIPAPATESPTASASRTYGDGLTHREAEVLALLADGLTSREIADMLVVTLATVSRHIANIYNKINARGRADATRYAIAHGITTPTVFGGKDGTKRDRPDSQSSRDLWRRGGVNG